MNLIVDFTATVCNAAARHEDYYWGSAVSHWLQSVQNSSCKTQCSIQDDDNSGLWCISWFLHV